MQQVIQGQVGTLEQRQGGWVAVSILTPGAQYPKKLSTKRQDLIQAAVSLQGQMVDALFNEEQGTTINPHTNAPYVNRYLEAIAPAGTLAQTGLVPQPQAQGGLTPVGATIPAVMAGVQQPQQGIVPQQPAPQPAGTLTHVVRDDGPREDRIMRQAATKVAGGFLAYLPDEERTLASLIRISEQLLRYYREGVSWTTNPAAPDQAQGYEAPMSPADQAQADYEASRAADEDIPF